MEQLINDIRAALVAGAYSLALQGALACVDICAALSADDGRTNRKHFKNWFEKYGSEASTLLTANDAYQLRCGILHQGRASGDQYQAIVFTLPNKQGITFHDNVMNGALNLDLEIFCTAVLSAAESWWRSSKDVEPVASNAEHLVQVRPDGLKPYFHGVPVLG